MPELPEVETVRRGLEMSIKGSTIKKVDLRRKDLRIPFPKDMAKRLEGQKITAISRRAKYLLFELSGEDIVIAHLGMSGSFSVVSKLPKKYTAHDHVIWHLSDGRAVIYNDPRRFGLITLAKKTDINSHPLLAKLGPEPLSKDFTTTRLKQAIAKRNTAIKVAIMDQEVVVGVGNIYASEALFLAGINPKKPANSVTEKATKLVPAIKKVLQDAIESGGSSLRDFIHVSGETGYFQHHFNVYGRGGAPCYTCGEPIKTVRLGGRSTFFCPKCQR